MTPSTTGRYAPFRLAPAPARSMTTTAPPETPTTKPYAPSVTASWASCTAAYATTPPTTNTPPGHTACQRRLDTLRTWDVYTSGQIQPRDARGIGGHVDRHLCSRT